MGGDGQNHTFGSCHAAVDIGYAVADAPVVQGEACRNGIGCVEYGAGTSREGANVFDAFLDGFDSAGGIDFAQMAGSDQDFWLAAIAL